MSSWAARHHWWPFVIDISSSSSLKAFHCQRWLAVIRQRRPVVVGGSSGGLASSSFDGIGGDRLSLATPRRQRRAGRSSGVAACQRREPLSLATPRRAACLRQRLVVLSATRARLVVIGRAPLSAGRLPIFIGCRQLWALVVTGDSLSVSSVGPVVICSGLLSLAVATPVRRYRWRLVWRLVVLVVGSIGGDRSLVAACRLLWPAGGTS